MLKLSEEERIKKELIFIEMFLRFFELVASSVLRHQLLFGHFHHCVAKALVFAIGQLFLDVVDLVH